MHQIIEQVVADLQRELGDDLHGILLTGSLADGVPRLQSDIDLFVVIRPLWRQRRTFFVDGVEVELFLNPVSQVRTEFCTPDSPATIAMFAQGRVLFDPEGIIKELVQEAQYVWQQGRPEIAEDTYEHSHLRYTCVDLLKDAQDLLDVDAEAAQLVMFAALQSALEAYYRLQRRWPVKPKYQLDDLELHAPDVAQQVRRILTDHLPLRERYITLSALIDQVLEPVGGRLREWSSPRQAVEEHGE